MGRIYKVGATLTPTIDSERDVFGATGFKASYIDKTNGTVTPGLWKLCGNHENS